MRRNQRTIADYMAELDRTDPAIVAEIDNALEERRQTTSLSLESVAGPDGGEEAVTAESIVLRVGRPVLDVRNDETVLDIDEVESQIWTEHLADATEQLAANIPAVGRIEIDNHPSGADWLGTGWLVRDDVVVTNRHVAEVFAHHDGAEFTFRPGIDGTGMRANIDFVEEFDNEREEEFPLFRVLHVEDDDGPDVAFFRIEPVAGLPLPEPVVLSETAAKVGDMVAVIGYPAHDPFFPDQDLMDRIFRGRYDKKRLAPGRITTARSERIHHDCSTLGGVSGGNLLSLETGRAVALHFAGTLFQRNHAVPAEVVGNRLDDVLAGRARPTSRTFGSEHQVVAAVGGGATAANVVSATIPIHITVEIGDGITGPARGAAPAPRPAAPSAPSGGGDDDDPLDEQEGRPEDYADRNGFDTGFLGGGFEVPRPQLTRNVDDTLGFEFMGEERDILDYQHFSVLMSQSRRISRWSACNIDGDTSKKRKRKGWRRDPRIADGAQIMKECYGNAPKFSRGHMTRREDPVWGSDDEASTGNADSMHVTNAVPQIQPFNAGIWLSLENYALDNTRDDDMRICVFTGPFLHDDDPFLFGVQIPLAFWKVIAFVHDQTGELSATGYTMSQESFIGEQEFVFGQHDSRQRPILEIEQGAGISFGRLAEVDPMRDAAEAASIPLTAISQIRFLR